MHGSKFAMTILVAHATLALGCGHASGAHVGGAHFSYAGESGPPAWGELAPGWEACEKGKQQSPIDMPDSATANEYPALEVNYASSALNILNNGHTIQVNYDAGSKITLAGTEYALRQFHFHAPSEHKVAGRSWPLELHLVHENAQGGLAVVGIFIKEGAENAALAKVFDNLPSTEGAAKTIAGATVQAEDFWPSDHAMWRYDGSLTTPPCSEGVKWHVLQTPIEASSAQIANFTRLVHDNARPIQELGGRAINAP